MGDVDHPDFAESLATVEGEATLARLALPISPPAVWDLLLVCQARPGSLRPEWLAPWQSRQPLAGQVVLLGSWCEGETRTGRPLEGLRRLFWYDFAPWWNLAQTAWQAGAPTEWQYPPGDYPPAAKANSTGTGCEPNGMGSEPRGTGCEPVLPIQRGGVGGDDYATASTLIDLCQASGFAAEWYPHGGVWRVGEPLEAGIWVGGMLDEREVSSLRRFRRRLLPAAPLLVLLDFPRRERVAQALALGATAVLGKPWQMEHLLAALATPRSSN